MHNGSKSLSVTRNSRGVFAIGSAISGSTAADPRGRPDQIGGIRKWSRFARLALIIASTAILWDLILFFVG